ncbi:E3 UFM1-protein ligase 1 homolog [Impatiens glandulifera]|uniref:E3 UFM1-protein ligase 1 homolog n=1 Tax=Impatiens glandulifera TaxID=253017 RepID=UPI001FB1653E|nr:E3 UFM1-protein ligase 1 homolog [Impatiens glandulifera]XP_047307876.1 E3 UFM1-protein ligase 1 homolog [Impatiens glandulifera]
MDEELLELQKQFESAQQAKSSIRLSDRNVVELIQKLHELQIIDFDLLHTITGKEYITPEQLRFEIVDQITKLGRVSLIDLADTTCVDLYHVEKQAQQIASSDASLMLMNGELISSSYWDNVAEEVNDRLQECSQIALAELAAQLQVGSELIGSVLEPRLGTLVKGRLEGGQLYTPAYVSRVNAMVLGAARGLTVPTNLLSLWSSLQLLLQEMDGSSGVAVENSFFQTLFNVLLKDGAILGSLRAGVNWTPAVFALAQKESVESFFSQNYYIGYDFLRKLGISQPSQYLQSRYPEGIPLPTIFVHSSMTEILDTAIEDALDRASWIDSLSVLPASFSSSDASKLLSLCQSFQLSLKSNKAIILGETYIFSNALIKDLFGQLEKELATFIITAPSADLRSRKEVKADDFTIGRSESSETASETGSNKQGYDKGSKKKKGKSAGNAKTLTGEGNFDDPEPAPSKSKKNQRKGKDTSSQILDTKTVPKKESDRTKADNLNLSEELLSQKIVSLIPELEEQDDLEDVLKQLTNQLRPMLLNSWKESKKAAFTENVQKLKSLADILQRNLDENFLNFQLYEKALDLFEDDTSTAVIFHRHLLRTMGTPMVDTLLLNLDMQNKLRNGSALQDSEKPGSASLNSGDRVALAKNLPEPLSAKSFPLIEALEGKRVETFMAALRDIAEESGLSLKKLDKKLERTLLHSYRKDLISQVSVETDPVTLLAKVVSLIYIQVYNKALQAPGRAISVAVARLKDKLDDSAYKILFDYQNATVTLLSLISAASGEEEDCSSDRILTKRELLEELMPSLKGIVLSNSNNQTKPDLVT